MLPHSPPCLPAGPEPTMVQGGQTVAAKFLNYRLCEDIKGKREFVRVFEEVGL